jgi:antitoxin HicB
LLYAVRLRPDDNGMLLVTSRVFRELTTFGEDRKEALHHTAAALTGLIESYMDRGLPIPTPRAKPGSRNLVVVPTLLAAKVALYMAMREDGVTQVELARRLGTTDGQVRRLLDPANSTRFDDLDRALAPSDDARFRRSPERLRIRVR